MFDKYDPKPATEELPREFKDLIEELAESVHDAWSAKRLAQGWSYGPDRDDQERLHPSLRPYASLSEEDKELDRASVRACLAAIAGLGYTVVKKPAVE